MLIEGYSLTEAFFMVVITVSTVGYTEVRPLSNAGELFSSIYILINVGLLAYILAVFSYYVIQGEIFKKMHLSFIQKEIEKLQQHVILCGFGRYGKEIATHFMEHKIPFVIVDNDPRKVEILQKAEERYLYIQDDATHDEVLDRAGIDRATAIIAALPDDSDNLFIVFAARQLNPKLNIISRAKNPRSERKLQLAGADHVILPEQIGGFYMATLVSKPGAVEFFSFITNEYQSDIGFEEIRYEEMPESCQNLSIAEMNIRAATGANIVGYKDPEGQYHVNPLPDTVLLPNSSFIILGSHDQLKALLHYIKNFPGKLAGK